MFSNVDTAQILPGALVPEIVKPYDSTSAFIVSWVSLLASIFALNISIACNCLVCFP